MIETVKVASGHYRIKKNGITYDIEMMEPGYGSKGWDIFVTNKKYENDYEWSARHETKKECIQDIEQR